MTMIDLVFINEQVCPSWKIPTHLKESILKFSVEKSTHQEFSRRIRSQWTPVIENNKMWFFCFYFFFHFSLWPAIDSGMYAERGVAAKLSFCWFQIANQDLLWWREMQKNQADAANKKENYSHQYRRCSLHLGLDKISREADKVWQLAGYWKSAWSFPVLVFEILSKSTVK